MDTKTRTYQFALKVIFFLDKIPKDMPTRVISYQLLKAATSIGANITESQASPTKRDFINFFTHALKSANETKFWLSLLKDTNKADKESVSALLDETEQISKILASSILTLKSVNKF
jgi:four helix bundle protein